MMVLAVMGSRPAVGESYKQQSGFGHHGAGDSHAAPHSSRQLVGKLVEGLLQFDEAQGFAHAIIHAASSAVTGRASPTPLPPSRQDAVIDQRVGDVFGNGERIEQAALLKQDSDSRANVEQVLLAEASDLLAEQRNTPESGLTRPTATLSSMVFPLPAAPKTT